MILEPLHPLCVSQHYFFYLYEIFLEYFCQRNSMVLGTHRHSCFSFTIIIIYPGHYKMHFRLFQENPWKPVWPLQSYESIPKKNCARSFVTSSKILLPCFGPVVKNYYSYASVVFFGADSEAAKIEKERENFILISNAK